MISKGGREFRRCEGDTEWKGQIETETRSKAETSEPRLFFLLPLT